MVAMVIEAAALIRTAAEIIRRARGREPYVVGTAIAALSLACSYVLFSKQHYRAAIVIAAAMVVILLVYKVLVLGW